VEHLHGRYRSTRGSALHPTSRLSRRHHRYRHRQHIVTAISISPSSPAPLLSSSSSSSSSPSRLAYSSLMHHESSHVPRARFKGEKRNARLEESFGRICKRDISRRQQHGEASLRILDEKQESRGIKMPPLFVIANRDYSRRARFVTCVRFAISSCAIERSSLIATAMHECVSSQLFASSEFCK